MMIKQSAEGALFERGALDRLAFLFSQYDYAWEHDPITDERIKLVPYIDDRTERVEKLRFLRSCVLREGYGIEEYEGA